MASKIYAITIWQSAAGKVCPQQRSVAHMIIAEGNKSDLIEDARKEFPGHKVTGSLTDPKNVSWLQDLYGAKVQDRRG